MKDRSEDLDLSIAEGSWWPEGVGRRSTRMRFFVHSSEKMEDGGFFVLRADKVEDGGFFVLLRKKSTLPPFFRPIFDSFFEAEDRT